MFDKILGESPLALVMALKCASLDTRHSNPEHLIAT